MDLEYSRIAIPRLPSSMVANRLLPRACDPFLEHKRWNGEEIKPPSRSPDDVISQMLIKVQRVAVRYDNTKPDDGQIMLAGDRFTMLHQYPSHSTATMSAVNSYAVDREGIGRSARAGKASGEHVHAECEQYICTGAIAKQGDCHP